MEKNINWILAIAAIINTFFLIRAMVIGSKAVADSILVFVILLVLYIYKKSYNLNVPTTILAGIYFFFHLLGSHGLYDVTLFGVIGYDKILHFFGPMILVVIVFNYITTKETDWTVGYIIGFAVLITLGINAFQEVVEFTGNSLLGRGEGVFFYGAGDLAGNDTPKDLIANFLGVTIGGIIIYLTNRFRK